MNLGKFSLSLAVKNLKESLAFYEKLGFEVIDGGHKNKDFPDTASEKWRIIASDSVKIGLFQGMFGNNLLSFNTDNFQKLQSELKSKGFKFLSEEGEEGKMCMLSDPDGNVLFFE